MSPLPLSDRFRRNGFIRVVGHRQDTCRQHNRQIDIFFLMKRFVECKYSISC